MQSNDLSTPYLSIVIPIYNEELRIGKTLQEIKKYINEQTFSTEVILVLNNCTDNTLAIIYNSISDDNRFCVIDLGILAVQGNTKGIAVAKGMVAARGILRVFTDADLATPLFEINNLIEKSEQGYDVVIGSRRAAGSFIEKNQTWYRVLLGRLGNKLIQLMAVPGIYDTQCGCKLFSEKSAREIFTRSKIAGWGFDIEILVLARSLGFSIAEIGVHWHDAPDSKVRANAYIQTLKELLVIFWCFKIKKR
jgi:dolichyl-phosphate beta-glucosyltransferase